jgi:hypothetical protein
MRTPAPAPARIDDWSAACDALYSTFIAPREAPGPGGWSLVYHDAEACHFERSDGGPDLTLLGVDWVRGTLRWGGMYAPKQDGGYHAEAALPEDWRRVLTALRAATWNETAPRFASPEVAGPALWAAADPARFPWVEVPWTSLPGDAPGGPVDLLFAPCGHPLDLVVLCVDRTAGTVTAALVDADGPISALGRAPLPPALLADLGAVPWPPGFAAEAVRDGRMAWTVRAAARVRAAASAPLPPEISNRGPIEDFVARYGPTRWQMPDAGITWGGPSWRFEEGVPRSTVYGRFRGTQAWVAVAFDPAFGRAEFVENAMGARPARVLGAFDVPVDWVPALAAAYRHR